MYISIPLASLLLSAIAAIVIVIDLWRNPQSMRIMSAVWVLTVLWIPLLGLLLYFTIGREVRMKMDMSPGMKMDMPKRPMWQSVVLSTLHCGAGCTLADIVGSLILVVVPVSLFGSQLFGGWLFCYLLALLFGIGFQYGAMRAMGGGSSRLGVVWRALKVDFFSLTGWQVGMYLWLAIMIFEVRYISADDIWSWRFWFAMQQAMFVGFLFSLPVNYALLRLGIKRAM